jgi:hypothetical protein
MAATFTPLTQAETLWLNQQLSAAEALTAVHCPEAAGQPLSPAILDRVWAAWVASGPSTPDAVNAGINAIGIAFGAQLVQQSGFSWVIASDEWGTDLAVLALPGTADVLVHPAHFVAKRWEGRETGFLQSAFQDINRRVTTLAKPDTESPAKRSFWQRLTGGV